MMRSLRTRIVIMLVFCIILTSLFTANVFVAAPQVWIGNSSNRVFNSTTMLSGTSTSISLYAARNEYESAQVCVRGTTLNLTNVYVTASALTGPSEATIPVSNVKVFREYLHTAVLSFVGSPVDIEVNPDGTNRVYDAFVESEPSCKVLIYAGVTVPYLYEAYVPSTRPPEHTPVLLPYIAIREM
jgi:hypothetical protein